MAPADPSAGIQTSLQPLWMNTSRTAADKSITYFIGSVVTGTLNGEAVLGTPEKRAIPHAPDADNPVPTSSPPRWQTIFQITTTVVGTLDQD